MEILSYPVGLLIGLLPLLFDLGDSGSSARLFLDGRQACTITGRAPACTVDLGPDPVIHLLELVRNGPDGQVTRTQRWVNRPGIEAQLWLAGRCDAQTRACEFLLTWAHPAKLDPTEISLAFDGVTVSRGASRVVHVGFPSRRAPQLITADATFADGRRASFTQLLGDSYTEQASASLEPVLLRIGTNLGDREIADSLIDAGWRLRTLEWGTFDVTFVATPGALDGMQNLTAAVRRNPGLFTNALQGAEHVRLVVAADAMASVDLSTAVPAQNLRRLEFGADFNSLATAAAEKEGNWMRRLIRGTGLSSHGRVRVADAVAAAGYDLGASSRRRYLVLLANSAAADDSVFSPAQAEKYLASVGVPISIWRIGHAEGKEWPDGPTLRTPEDLIAQLAELRRAIDRQRVAWVQRRFEGETSPTRLPNGVALIGQQGQVSHLSNASTASSVPDAPTYALEFDPASPRTIYAGGRAGLRISEDAGEHWFAAADASQIGEIYAIAVPAPGVRPLLGSSAGIGFWNELEKRWVVTSMPPVFALAVDPESPNAVLAARRDGVIRTSDGGRTWASSSKGLEKTFALAIAADPNAKEVFYTATAGEGVFKSVDGGKSWRIAGLSKVMVRSLLVSRNTKGVVYAGTDGGIYTSNDEGKTWQRMSAGLPRGIVYSLITDPKDHRWLFAGTAAGLFESLDGGSRWRPITTGRSITDVLAIIFDSTSRNLFAGSLGQGVSRFELSRQP